MTKQKITRQIIKIDEDECIGCGLCESACHEGAIKVIDGKAKLLRDDYCDGLGNCLPVCPTGAITFEEREAEVYNEEVAPKRVEQKQKGGCPGSMAKVIVKENKTTETNSTEKMQSELNNWPVQIQLAPVNAGYFENANLLIAADCSAYAYANFHNEFLKNRVALIGCPKLDTVEYSEKLTKILELNNIKSVTIVRMEVPCCGGLETATISALKNSGKMIPWQIHTISIDGEILNI